MKYLTPPEENVLIQKREESSDLRFWLGDFVKKKRQNMAVTGQRYSIAELNNEVAIAFGVKPSVVRQRYEVAVRVPQDVREEFPQLTFSHFRVVAYKVKPDDIMSTLWEATKMEPEYNGQPISVAALEQKLSKGKVDDVVEMAYKKRDAITGNISKLQELITVQQVDVVGNDVTAVWKRLETIAEEIEAMDFEFIVSDEMEAMPV